MPTQKTSRHPLTLTAGALWGTSCLLLVVSAAIAIPTAYVAAPSWLRWIGVTLLAAAALALLAMTVMTLPRPRAYEWDADLSALPAPFRWPVRIGTWASVVGAAVTEISALFAGGPYADAPTSNARFAMSLAAVVGAIVTLFVAATVPPAVLIGLLCVWGTVIALCIVRGVWGLIARLLR